MTLHVIYNHKCAQCQAHYIPYDQDISCPRCGLVESQRYDLIPEAVRSLQFNKRKGGRYTPGAWWVSSLADHILSLLFGILDGFDDLPAPKEFAPYVAQCVANIKWGDQEYLGAHVQAIALCVHDELQRAPDSPESIAPPSALKTSLARISFLVAVVLFITGFLVLCHCPGWFALAAAFATLAASLGTRSLRTIAILLLMASLTMTAIQTHKKLQQDAQVRALKQKAAPQMPGVNEKN